VAAFTAFYDANALYPAELRNLLMHLALTGLFRRISNRFNPGRRRMTMGRWRVARVRSEAARAGATLVLQREAAPNPMTTAGILC
jgi:hypothetical protein